MNMTSKEILAKLIGFDTVSARSNLNLIHWVQDYLSGFGVTSTLISDDTKSKANLCATVFHPGKKPDKPGIVLSGHTDVVPTEGQAWDSDPFSLTEKDGLLFGRGTCDMKGFIAVALSKVPDILAAKLPYPVHLAFSYDEEVGCLGAHDLAAHIAALPERPGLCIVGEPTMMKPIIGHKGICDYECHVRGREAHSSLAPYAVNAVEYASELVAFIKGIARRMSSEGPFNKSFDPPFTTLHVGMMQGGTALNIVPNNCHFSFEIRNIPEVNPDDLLEEIRKHAFTALEPRMKDIDVKTGFELRTTARVPAFDIPAQDPSVALVLSVTGANQAEKVSFATEAGIFQQQKIPTIVCGPGAIAQAHKPNEFVAIEQMQKCETFIDRLLPGYAQKVLRAA
jgi:acetylornithine deacetylase